MLARFLNWLARLRTWLRVRLGLWRGTWRRGQVSVPSAALLPGLLANASWSYGLYCPRGLRDDVPAPLVVLLHGCKQRALAFAQASGFTQAADAQRFRLLCPEQRRRANLWRCWNWFAPAAQRGAGELDVVRAMLGAVSRSVAVAPDRVAAVGLSAGGALAALLAFHAADRFAAVATVAAPPLLGRGNLQDPRDVMRRGLHAAPTRALDSGRDVAALLVVQGRADTVVTPVCAEQLAEQAVHRNERNGPTLTLDESAPAPGLHCVDWRRDGQLRVRALRIETLGHAWSGAPGGHPFVQADGPPLTAHIVGFLADAGVIANGR